MRRWERRGRKRNRAGTERPTLPASEKAPQGFIKNTVFELLEPVYAEATENGTYSIMMRQLFYELRPRFHAVADREAAGVRRHHVVKRAVGLGRLHGPVALRGRGYASHASRCDERT